MSLNKVMLIGNVGKDPEVRYLDNSANIANTTKVATFPLATSERYKDRNGVVHESTEWHNIVAWRGLADILEKYVKKGTQLYIEGRLSTRSWTDQNGVKKFITEIVADSIQILTKKADQAANNNQTSAYQQPINNPQNTVGTTPEPAYQAPVNVESGTSDDDLPF